MGRMFGEFWGSKPRKRKASVYGSVVQTEA